MKTKLRSIVSLAVLLGLVFSASAQAKPAADRRFAYTCSDAVASQFLEFGPVAFKSTSTITVNPYLYIMGELGSNWVISGWGTGEDIHASSIRIYHNESVTLVLNHFADLAKVSGTSAGAQSISMQGQLRFFYDQSGSPVYDSGILNATALNGAFQLDGPTLDARSKTGSIRVEFSRKVTITPDVGPGLYQSTGTITVIRN